jgi:putative transposase
MSKPREIDIGMYYHIYSRGVNKCETYIDEIDFLRFEKLLDICNTKKNVICRNFTQPEEKTSYPLVKIVSYCLMPNHFHMILQEVHAGGISLFLQKVLSGYSTYFNKKYSRTGALFGSRFKNKVIDTDVYFHHLLTYIWNNPIKIINPHYTSKDILIGNMILTTQEKDFAKNYPYKFKLHRSEL